MKKILNIFAFFLSLIVIISCEPGRDENGDLLFGVNNTGETGGGTTNSRLLKKMVSHAINEDTGEWEDSQIVYNYTGNRLVSYDDGSGELTNFTYNGNNKISNLSSSSQNAVFTYSGANLSKISSTVAGGMYTVNTDFTYTGSQLKKAISIQEFTFPIPSKVYIETDYEYNGLNMGKAFIKGGFYLPNGELEMNPEIQILTFEYDNKKNPFQLLPKEFFIYLSGIAPQGATYLSANNMTKYTTTIGGITTDVQSATYTYDSESYPIMMSNDLNETTKFEYQ